MLDGISARPGHPGTRDNGRVEVSAGAVQGDCGGSRRGRGKLGLTTSRGGF